MIYFVQDSCQKGWRLFSIIAAYFTCSPLLKPYLFKYLESSAYDKRRAYHGTALVSSLAAAQLRQGLGFNEDLER